MKPLHSKTASKAGSSLWIPAGRGAPPKMAKTSLVQLNDDLIGSILVMPELTAIDHQHLEIMNSKKNQQIVIAFQVAENPAVSDLDSL